MADTDTLPNGTAAAEEDERLKQRPADIDADVREMERRKRVEALMSSKLFREELERVLDQQLNEGSDAPLLQRIKEMVGGRLHTGSLRGPSCVLPINDIRGIEGVGYEKGEKILRCKLAAVYRLVDLFGWTQTGQSGQITARLNTAIEQVLTTPRGLLPHEVTASSLVKVDMQGQVVDQGTTNFPPNVDGFAIHGVVHAARPDVRCVVHVRSLGALAVSASRRGLVPLCPEAAALGEVAYHRVPYGPLDNEERDKIVRALGPHAKVLMLTSNGALCCGGTLEEAFFQARQLVAACEVQLRLASIPLDDLQLIDEETRKQIYDAAHTPPADTVGGKWRAGGEEFEALMRMLDNAGFRTGYIYRRPLVKNDVPKPRNDVEVPPAVSSLGYLLEEEELYRQGLWKRGTGVAGERTRWLNSPNVYQKVEVLETGTNDPRRITKWVDANNDEWVQDGSPANSSTPVKIHTLQFVPKNTNPKEFKALQQQIKDNRRADKISAGPQSHILEGVTWDEASKLVGEDAANTHTGDHVVLMGAASKGIIQRGYQHNATMYSAPYARNPFDHVSDREIDEYRRTVERKQRSDYDTDLSESEALSAAQITSPASQPSETEEESRDEHRVLRIETKQVPVRSQPEVVLSDDEPRDPNLLSDDEVFLDSPITSGLTSPTSELTDLAGPTSGMTSPMPAVTGPMPAMPVQGPIVIRAHHAPMQQTVIRGTPKLSPELAEALSTSKRSVHDYPRSTNFDSVVKVYGSPETGDKKLTDLSLDLIDNEVESKKEHPKCKVSLNTRLEVKCDALEVFNPGCNSSRSSLYSIPSIEWDGRCKSEYVLRTQSLPRQRSRENQDRLYRTRSHSGFVNSQIKDPEPKHFHLPRCRSCGAASSSYALETGKEERGRRIPTSLYLSVDNIPQRCLEEELNIVKVKERQVPVFKVDKGNSNDVEFVDSQEFNEDNYIDIGNSFSSDNQTVIEKNGASDQDETVKDDTLKAESGIDTVSNETNTLYRAECVAVKDDSNSSNVDVDATISTEGEYLSFSEDMDFEHSAYESPVKDLVEKDIRDYSVPINFYCEDYQKKEGSPVKSPFKILENVKQNLLEPILEESKSFTADDSGNLSGNTDVIGLNRVSADNADRSDNDDCDIIPQSNFKSDIDSRIEPRELFAAEVNVSELIEQFQDKIDIPANINEPNIGDYIKHKVSNAEKDEEEIELAQHFPHALNDNLNMSNMGNCIDCKGSNAMELEEPELALHSSENDNLNKCNIVDKESNATEVQEMEEKMNFPANIIECHIGDSIKYNESNEDEEEIELAQHFPNNATDILNKCTIGDSVEIKDSNATEVQETELAIHFLDKMNDVQSNKFDITDKFEHRENIATIGDSVENKDSNIIERLETELAIHFLDKMNDVQSNKFDITDKFEHRENNATIGDSIENKDSKTIEIQESELAIHFLDKMNDVEQNKFDIKDNIEHRENNATVGDSVGNKDSNASYLQEEELAIHYPDKMNDVQSDITEKVEHREINATEVAEAEFPEHFQEKLQDPGEYDININNTIIDESIDVIVQNFIDDLLERAISIFQLKIEIETCPDKVTVDILEKECVEKQESFVVCDEDDTVTSDVERVSMIAVQTALEIYSNSESEGVEQDAVHLEQDVVVETVIDNVFEILSNNALLESGETYHKDRWSAASLASSGLERRSIDTTIEFEKNEAIADVIALLLKKVDVVTDRGFLDNVTKDRHVIINFNSKETLKIMEIESSEESEATTVDTTDSDCRFDNFENFSISKIIQDIERSESLLFASDISDSDSIDSLKVIEGFVYYILDQVYFRIASKDNLKIEKSVKKVVTIVDHEDILYTALPIWSHSGVSPQKMYENHEKQEKDAAVSLMNDIEASLFNKGGPIIKDDDDDELLVSGGFLGVKSVDLKLDEYDFNEMRNISAPTNSEQSIIDDEPVCCGICLNINTNVTSDTSVASDLTDVDNVTTVHQTEIVKESISCDLDNPSTETMNSIAVIVNQIDFQSAIDNDNFNKEDANIVSSNISLQFVTDLKEPSEYTQSETLRKYNKDHESKYVYEKITYKSIDSTESIIIIDDVNTEIVNENTQHESVNHLEISSVKAVVQTTYDEFNTDKTIEITNGVLKSDHVINIQDDAQNFEIAEKLPFKGDGEAEHSHVVEHVYTDVVTEEVYEKHEFEHNRDDLTERFSADFIDVANDCTEEESYTTAAGIIEDILERSSSLQCEISCLRCKEQQELRGADVDNFLNETFVIKDDEEEMNTAFVETNAEFYSRSSSPRDSTPFEICNESPIKNPNDNFIGNDLSVLYEKDDTLLGSPFVKQAPVISMSQIENTRGVKYWISFDDSLTEIEHRPLYRPIRRLDNKIPSFFAIDLNDTSEYETIETDSFWDVQDGKDTFKRSSVLYSADKAIPTHEHDPRCNTNVKEDSYASCSSVDYKTCDSESLDSNALEKKLLYDSRIDLHSKPSRRYNSWPPFEETLLYRIVSKFRMSESFDPSEFDDVQFNTSL